MAGLGGGERGRHGVGVAHFSDQNYVGNLPHRRPDSLGKAGRIVPDLDLLHDRSTIRMLVFNRVLDGDDVVTAPGIDQFDERRERRALAAARWSGQEHQALAAFRQVGKSRAEGEGSRASEPARAERGLRPRACPAGNGNWPETGRWTCAQTKNRSTVEVCNSFCCSAVRIGSRSAA